MARDQQIAELKKKIDSVLVFEKASLLSRTKWGEITFEDAHRDLDRIYDVLQYLNILPLEYLPDDVVNVIDSECTQVKTVFDRLDKFSLQDSNPTQTRNQISNDLHTRADSLFKAASLWIPFLAYKKGDVTENINKLAGAVTDARGMIEQSKADVVSKGKEIDGIIVKAREASGKAGAAVFTQDFANEATALASNGRTWLVWTGVFALITVLTAVGMWAFTEAGLDQNQVWQKLTTKLAILAVLISTTAWCGKIYKALMHQSTVNKHRALCLQTFQAFSAAATEPQTKDAVLIQTTRAIFSDSPTGFVDSGQSGHDSDIKILEIVRSLLPGTDKK